MLFFLPQLTFTMFFSLFYIVNVPKYLSICYFWSTISSLLELSSCLFTTIYSSFHLSYLFFNLFTYKVSHMLIIVELSLSLIHILFCPVAAHCSPNILFVNFIVKYFVKFNCLILDLYCFFSPLALLFKWTSRTEILCWAVKHYPTLT